MRKAFVISLELPEDVSEAEMIEYLEEAVGCWKGSYHPDNPLFDLEGKTVRARRANAEELEETHG